MFTALTEHLVLVFVSTLIAVLIGVPLGIIAYRKQRIGSSLIGFANIVQTIPSLAMFGFLIPLPFVGGIGAKAALIVLILYALLPVMRTTVSGFRAIDPVIRDAGIAMGMTSSQLLRIVELPLALNSIIAGVRVATVVGVGTATIAAAIGAGGLGQYIFRGVAMVDNTVILAGAIPAAVLALVADFSLGLVEHSLAPEQRRQGRQRIFAVAVIVIAALLLIFGGIALGKRQQDQIVIGSKDFTEQLLLGELLAQVIEHNSSLKVIRKLGLGDTLVCETAMRAGDIDAYVEYTGTALTTIFKQPILTNADEVNARVAKGYQETGRTMLAPLGFNNTFAILIRGSDARRLNLRTITDAARFTTEWRAGFGPAFLDREDGYRGLVKTYNLKFAEAPRAMNLSLTYRALAENQIDLIAGDATNGLVDKLDLFMLADDRHYFPPYQAVPVVRTEMLDRHPELRSVLQKLAGQIPETEMRRMNYLADVEHQDIP
ncbi:MAG TPA: ABC transporter permease/substrate-binding protein, partial [Blastocatellia bacterium]|nr:ABC transporter permease/substrate-binding protein [Blastocatellia bacterium]